ncbi:PKD domain-containing protein [Haloarchaeobius sp. HRN-SO-5]|uniref:PKD domain-containing protein n=1 Tax=Haloarchaeobius sp. HRN-SO-5 TaxID=3446118 RepID=UPI003EB7DD13
MILSVATAGTAGAATSSAPPGSTIGVAQGDQCWEVTPYGDGTTNVSEFYDYRTPNTTPSGELWGSYGTRDLQVNQGSVILFYDGAEGTSIVFLQDKLGEPHGGTVTYDISGLPESGEWVVEDEAYAARDDNFDYFENGTVASIDWKWSDGRGDGGAFRGIDVGTGVTDTSTDTTTDGTTTNDSTSAEMPDEQSAITIEAGFNEAADKWNSWGYARGENRTKGWYVRSGAGGMQQLDMSEPIQILPGGCPDDGTSMLMTMEHERLQEGTSVRFQVNATAPNGSITSYEWDWNGDGQVDDTTSEGSITHEFESTGLKGVTVTAISDSGDEASFSEIISVMNQSQPGDNPSNPGNGTTDGTTAGPVTDDGTDDQPMTDETTGPGDGTGTPTDGGPTPGFGVGAALVALVAAALFALRSIEQ